MRKIYFISSAIFTILALILAFENIMITFAGYIFLTATSTTVFYPLLIMLFGGITVDTVLKLFGGHHTRHFP